MTIPKHDDIRVPALQLLTEHDSIKLNEFEAPLAKRFGLSEDELSQEYDSGNGKIFYDRISWALSYMNMAGLVQKPKRGTYQISDIGKVQLRTPEKINYFIETQIKQREPVKKEKTSSVKIINAALTPQEELYGSFSKIQLSVYNEIIDVILDKSPREFEKLVVTLLQKMGYGGEVKAAGMVTQYSNDKGIDGIIKEDGKRSTKHVLALFRRI
ncbi:winged helix-turn-helix domain-containing protein [Methyloprofundus sp.]|uniref:winged helix-turn-helix domain-containing protein n=1 Tax=Methyloprofundus sp. TaxID=2020875 RepID=UPI003D13ABFC